MTGALSDKYSFVFILQYKELLYIGDFNDLSLISFEKRVFFTRVCRASGVMSYWQNRNKAKFHGSINYDGAQLKTPYINREKTWDENLVLIQDKKKKNFLIKS